MLRINIAPHKLLHHIGIPLPLLQKIHLRHAVKITAVYLTENLTAVDSRTVRQRLREKPDGLITDALQIPHHLTNRITVRTVHRIKKIQIDRPVCQHKLHAHIRRFAQKLVIAACRIQDDAIHALIDHIHNIIAFLARLIIRVCNQNPITVTITAITDPLQQNRRKRTRNIGNNHAKDKTLLRFQTARQRIRTIAQFLNYISDTLARLLRHILKFAVQIAGNRGF